jgi:hypothetical protein
LQDLNGKFFKDKMGKGTLKTKHGLIKERYKQAGVKVVKVQSFRPIQRQNNQPPFLTITLLINSRLPLGIVLI